MRMSPTSYLPILAHSPKEQVRGVRVRVRISAAPPWPRLGAFDPLARQDGQVRRQERGLGKAGREREVHQRRPYVGLSARHNAAARHKKYGQRWGEFVVLIQKHHSLAWVTRAKEDLEPYLAAAMEGTLPNMVKCSCECKNTHHVMCSKTGKRRQADAEIINPVLMWLRKLANQVR